MPDFLTILAEFEQRAPAAGSAPRRTAFAPPDPIVRNAASRREAVDAYGADRAAPVPPDQAAFRREIEQASNSPRRLRRLRRRIAWSLHPDRAHNLDDAALLAELNATMDAALRKL